jgi:uncharacterized protein (TIGR02271 family)
MIIVREDGKKGSVTRKIKRKGRPDQLVIEFDDGTRLMTTEDQLTLRKDGTALLSRSSASLSSIPLQPLELAPGEELVIPVAIEELQVQKRRVVRGGVHVETRVETNEQTVDEPLLLEEVTIERTPIDKEIHGETPTVYEQDGTLVIPVIEEVLVVAKQLRLKEEIRVIRRKRSVHEPQKFQVRRQLVKVERVKEGTVLAEEARDQVPFPQKTGAADAIKSPKKSPKPSTEPQSHAPKEAAPATKKSPSVAKAVAPKKQSSPRAPKKKQR